MNADKLTPDALQALMRHKSYQTTQVYINMAGRWTRPWPGCTSRTCCGPRPAAEDPERPFGGMAEGRTTSLAVSQ